MSDDFSSFASCGVRLPASNLVPEETKTLKINSNYVFQYGPHGVVSFSTDGIVGSRCSQVVLPHSIVYQPHRIIQSVDILCSEEVLIVCGDRDSCLTIHRNHQVSSVFLPEENYFAPQKTGKRGVVEVIASSHHPDYLLCHKARDAHALWMVSMELGSCWPLETDIKNLHNLSLFRSKVGSKYYGVQTSPHEFIVSPFGEASPCATLNIGKYSKNKGDDVLVMETDPSDTYFLLLSRTTNGAGEVFTSAELFDLRYPKLSVWSALYPFGWAPRATAVNQQGFVILDGKEERLCALHLNDAKDSTEDRDVESLAVCSLELQASMQVKPSTDVVFHNDTLLYIMS